MISGQHIGMGLLRRSLVSAVMLSLSLMSFAVDACETFCLFDGFRCARMSSEVSAPANLMGSAPSEMGSMVTPCDRAEFCKDATTSVMRPAARVEIQKAQQTTIGIPFAVKWSNRGYLTFKAESPPPESPPLNPLSTNLRI